MNTAAAQPLLFLGDRRRDALVARAGDRLRAWRQSWTTQTEEFEITFESAGASGPSAPVAGITTTCWSLELDAQHIAVLLLPHGTFCWAVQEAGGSTPEMPSSGCAGSLAEKLEADLARSLLAAVCGFDKPGALVVERVSTDLDAWARAARAWQLQARACSGGRAFNVLIAASRVEAMAPARAPVTGQALGARLDAIGGNTVAVRAVVGEAAMNVGELAGLSLDDVLVLDRQLSEPVALVSANTGATVVTGHLGRSGESRALKVAGVPAAKN